MGEEGGEAAEEVLRGGGGVEEVGAEEGEEGWGEGFYRGLGGVCLWGGREGGRTVGEPVEEG